MRHGRRAHLAFHNFLLKIIHRNIQPNIAAQIDQQGANPLQRVEIGRQVVVMLYLSGITLAFQAEAGQKFFCKTVPVFVGVCHIMRVEVAAGASKLSFESDIIKMHELTVQAFGKNHDFFSYPGRRGRLAMGVGQHGNIAPLPCQGMQAVQQLVERRQYRIQLGFFDEQRHGRIIDILGGKPEMYKLFVCPNFHGIELFTQKILHGFHIVIGDFLDFFDFYSIVLVKVSVNIPYGFKFPLFDLLQCRYHGTQLNKILCFNKYSFFDECILRKISGKCFGSFMIPAINRRNGS